MKNYNSRQELSEDIDFLKKTLLDLETKSRYVDELFHHLFNYTSNLVLKMNCNLNNYINCSLRYK